MRTHRSCSALPLLTFVAIASIVSACSKSGSDNGASDSTSAASASVTPSAAGHDTGMGNMSGMAHDSGMAGMSGMSNMSNMTGNPDRDFLRMMTDHHKGLIALSHATVDRQGASADVRADARKFDKVQDAELDTMTTMLEKQYKDPYTPKVTPENKAMNDSVLAKSGTAFDRAFREEVIMHHEMGIKMMDQYLPKLTDAKLKTMVQRMRADQTRDIADLRRKLGQS